MSHFQIDIMDMQEFNRQFQSKMQEIQQFVEGDEIKDIAGVEAVNHFQESFDNEGFTDETLEPWDDVARRDPNSPWYGHSGFSSEKSNKKSNKRDTKLVSKFSQARATAKILRGETSELRNSIDYKHTEKGVRVTSPTPYGRVHQFGLQSKIYGKGEFTQKKRPFMGKSKLLKANIEDKIKREIIKILTKK